MGEDKRGAEPTDDFIAAAEEARPSLVNEFVYYVRRYKRWSIVPILLALALIGAFINVGGSGMAPFIYALF